MLLHIQRVFAVAADRHYCYLNAANEGKSRTTVLSVLVQEADNLEAKDANGKWKIDVPYIVYKSNEHALPTNVMRVFSWCEAGLRSKFIACARLVLPSTSRLWVIIQFSDWRVSLPIRAVCMCTASTATGQKVPHILWIYTCNHILRLVFYENKVLIEQKWNKFWLKHMHAVKVCRTVRCACTAKGHMHAYSHMAYLPHLLLRLHVRITYKVPNI